ncbi:hypothetical protein G7Y89_g1716 [Cudoniella acicularis]|uniref:Uncharacterized protein n=1 Tax=Cudoniella acicularis TaxID=354080 RepID=A0A8H4RWI7_9HELO|nr:hypothetical protein G7Y89_g1716 [Cudoniella acicularis]
MQYKTIHNALKARIADLSFRDKSRYIVDYWKIVKGLAEATGMNPNTTNLEERHSFEKLLWDCYFPLIEFLGVAPGPGDQEEFDRAFSQGNSTLRPLGWGSKFIRSGEGASSSRNPTETSDDEQPEPPSGSRKLHMARSYADKVKPKSFDKGGQLLMAGGYADEVEPKSFDEGGKLPMAEGYAEYMEEQKRKCLEEWKAENPEAYEFYTKEELDQFWGRYVELNAGNWFNTPPLPPPQTSEATRLEPSLREMFDASLSEQIFGKAPYIPHDDIGINMELSPDEERVEYYRSTTTDPDFLSEGEQIEVMKLRSLGYDI